MALRQKGGSGAEAAQANTSLSVLVHSPRIEQARQRMQRRNPGGDSKGRLSAAALRQTRAIEAAPMELWEQLIDQRGLSTRSSLQLLRVARTIADLNDRASVDRNAVAEASCFRCTDLLKQPGAQ